MRLLLESGADIAETDFDGRTVLHKAADNGYEALAQLLLELGADVTRKDDSGCIALDLAAYNGHEAVVWLLLESGADVMLQRRVTVEGLCYTRQRAAGTRESCGCCLKMEWISQRRLWMDRQRYT
jgi:hypothetical protein